MDTVTDRAPRVNARCAQDCSARRFRSLAACGGRAAKTASGPPRDAARTDRFTFPDRALCAQPFLFQFLPHDRLPYAEGVDQRYKQTDWREYDTVDEFFSGFLIRFAVHSKSFLPFLFTPPRPVRLRRNSAEGPVSRLILVTCGAENNPTARFQISSSRARLVLYSFLTATTDPHISFGTH